MYLNICNIEGFSHGGLGPGLGHSGPVHLISINTSVLWPAIRARVMAPVFLGTLRMSCTSNCVQPRTEQTAVPKQAKKNTHNMAAHIRCWSWKAGQMVEVGISRVKKNIMHSKMVHGCVLHWCRDAPVSSYRQWLDCNIYATIPGSEGHY